MIKIIIAEDQQLILKDLVLKIQKLDMDIEIIATALNGQEAYDKVVALKPDILITDIKMPLLTGLELIAKLTANYIAIHTIIISGYKDFEYAREAIKLGVDEYLLKPLSKDDISFVLKNIVNKINKTKEYSEKLIIDQLLRSHIKVTTLQPDSSFNHYYLMTVIAGSYPTFTIECAIPHSPIQDLVSIKSISDSYLFSSEKLYVCHGKSTNETICVFCLKQSTKNTVRNIALEALKQVATQLPLSICISEQLGSLQHIGVESQIMRNHLANHSVFGSSRIFDINNLSVNAQDPKSSLADELLKTTTKISKMQNSNLFSQELQSLLALFEKKEATQKELSLFLKELYKKCFPQKNPLAFEMEIDEFLTNSKSYTELFNFLEFHSIQLIKSQSNTSLYASTPEELVSAIKKYMETHYMEELTINDIACHFSLTPAYFSRLFKKYTTKTPIDYLTEIRITQASYYFTNTDLPIKEITNLCGYSDPFYFSKVFKAVKGVSPSKYRVQYYTQKE